MNQARHLATMLPALALVLLAAGPLAAQWPPEPKNLQVFPEDIDTRQLLGAMRGFSRGLGVRCQHCHVGEEGQPLSTFDFASDDKAAKLAARAMMRMVRSINEQVADAITDGSEPVAVRCVTCHRGVLQPEQLEDLLAREAASGGVEAALTRYAELREKHYGSHTYDFGEGTLVRTAEAVGREDPGAAIALLQRNLELFPDSAWTLGTLAQAQQQAGDGDGAIATLERLLALDPDNERVQRMLEQTRAAPAEGDG